jgi:hypothetical protein
MLDSIHPTPRFFMMRDGGALIMLRKWGLSGFSMFLIALCFWGGAPFSCLL